MKRAHVFLVFHIILIVLLLSTFANAWIAPSYFSRLNLLSLAFPYLIILHLLFTLIWFFKRKKTALIFLFSTFIFYNPVKRWVNFTPQRMAHSKKNEIKVLTFNVKYGSSGWQTVKKYITNQNADIILVQEKDTARELRKDLVKYPSVILKTRHKILRQEDLFDDHSKGNAFYADVDINGKIIRIINVYLEPFRLNKNMLGIEDEDNCKKKEKNKITALFSRLLPTFITHEDQVRKIRKAIDKSPYPVILAGDFNSVPNSWEYYNLGKNLDDAFVEAGNGSSTSFHDFKFPLRIDYIFSSKSIKPLTYKVDYSVKLSDHYPVIAEFLLN